MGQCSFPAFVTAIRSLSQAHNISLAVLTIFWLAWLLLHRREAAPTIIMVLVLGIHSADQMKRRDWITLAGT